MALERQSIEKKDFPIGRRGYDPDAVDVHLRSLADEIEDLKRSSRRRNDTLASVASDQVRAIVEAAETSAAEIQRQAEQEAKDIRSDARSEAKRTRGEASTQAKEYVEKVSESTAGMLQRLDAMESELGALLESLRTGSNRLNADLQLLESNLGDVREAVTPSGRFEPEAGGASDAYEEPVGEPEGDPGIEQFVDAEPVGAGEEAYEETPAIEEPATEAVANGGEANGADDAEGARLIALNMALNGTPREETDRYLAENFELSNRDALLDEVYSSVDG